jgi:hypothetical protein
MMLCYSALMLADSYIVPECIAQPRSFGGLMALYEGNYIKLNGLITKLGQQSGQFMSYTANDCDLRLIIETRTRYTCLMRLTYLFPVSGTTVADPDLCTKVYFDARMAEVRSWAKHHRHEVLRNLDHRYSRELDRRWSRNMMLSKWLDYLLDMGHAFPARQIA